LDKYGRDMQHAWKMREGKCAGNRPPGTTALGSKDNIKMGPKANSWQNIDLLHLAQDSDQLQGLTKAVMHFGLT